MTILLVSGVGALTAEKCQTTVSVTGQGRGVTTSERALLLGSVWMCQAQGPFFLRELVVNLLRGTEDPEKDLPTTLVLPLCVGVARL